MLSCDLIYKVLLQTKKKNLLVYCTKIKDCFPMVVQISDFSRGEVTKVSNNADCLHIPHCISNNSNTDCESKKISVGTLETF